MKVLVTGGGTGGHIYPALALINHMKECYEEIEFLYIGTSKGLEADIVPKAGIEMKYIEISGFKRSLSLHNFKVIYQFIQACMESRKIIRTFQPDVVIGTGGFVCGPVVYTAAKMGVPSIIHEQNSIPGLTNKFLSRYVDTVAVTFPDSKHLFPAAKHITITGNPRASEVSMADANKGRESLALKDDTPIVLVVGGSRGAKAINEAMEKLLKEHSEFPFQLIFITGTVHYEKFADKANHHSDVHIIPFVYNMPEVLASSNLVIGRAGATFLAEITSLGIPAILIPSPYVTNNHQYHNAKALGDAGAAILIQERELHQTNLLEVINSMITNSIKYETYKNASKKLGIPEAAEEFRKEIERLITSKKR